MTLILAISVKDIAVGAKKSVVFYLCIFVYWSIHRLMSDRFETVQLSWYMLELFRLGWFLVSHVELP